MPPAPETPTSGGPSLEIMLDGKENTPATQRALNALAKIAQNADSPCAVKRHWAVSVNDQIILRRKDDAWVNVSQMAKCVRLTRARRQHFFNVLVATGPFEEVGGASIYTGIWAPLRKARELAIYLEIDQHLHKLLASDPSKEEAPYVSEKPVVGSGPQSLISQLKAANSRGKQFPALSKPKVPGLAAGPAACPPAGPSTISRGSSIHSPTPKARMPLFETIAFRPPTSESSFRDISDLSQEISFSASFKDSCGDESTPASILDSSVSEVDRSKNYNDIRSILYELEHSIDEPEPEKPQHSMSFTEKDPVLSPDTILDLLPEPLPDSLEAEGPAEPSPLAKKVPILLQPPSDDYVGGFTPVSRIPARIPARISPRVPGTPVRGPVRDPTLSSKPIRGSSVKYTAAPLRKGQWHEHLVIAMMIIALPLVIVALHPETRQVLFDGLASYLHSLIKHDPESTIIS